MSERRMYTRVSSALHGLWELGEHRAEVFVSDLSLAGALITVNAPCASDNPPEEAELVVTPPEGDSARVPVRIVWRRSAGRFGLAFLRMTRHARQTIANYLLRERARALQEDPLRES